MKVLVMLTEDESSFGIDSVEINLYSNVDSAWDDFLDRVEYIGGSENELENGTKEDCIAGKDVAYYGSDVNVYLNWKEVEG